jgi:hypothetical protein
MRLRPPLATLAPQRGCYPGHQRVPTVRTNSVKQVSVKRANGKESEGVYPEHRACGKFMDNQFSRMGAAVIGWSAVLFSERSL